jgi:hypothetical protein
VKGRATKCGKVSRVGSNASHRYVLNGSAGSELTRVAAAFPFDTPDIFLQFELTSHTIKSGVFETWKVRYNLHEYKGAKNAPVSLASVVSLAALAAAANTTNGGNMTKDMLYSAKEVRRKLQTTKAMISFKQYADNMPCFDIMHSGVSVKFPAEKKKVRASSCVPRVSTFSRCAARAREAVVCAGQRGVNRGR